MTEEETMQRDIVDRRVLLSALPVGALAVAGPALAAGQTGQPSANLALIQGLYANFARGDIPAVLGAMDDGIVWNEAEGNPYADLNPYVGPQAVLEGLFARVGGEWEGFAVHIDQLFDAGDTITAVGRYSGVYRATGRATTNQVAHVWTLNGGKVVSFQQYADTRALAWVMGEIN